MLAVSQKWKDAIQGQFRYPAYLRFTLAVIPPGLIKHMQITANDTEPFTSTEQIKDGKLGDKTPVATFEPDRWVGDGSMYLLSEDYSQNKPLEWWSNKCEFSSVKLRFDFDKPYTIPGIHAVWDTETKSWPTKLVVTGYNSDGSVGATHTITTIDSERGFFDAPIKNAQSIVLDIQEWSKPGWRVRINELIFGILISFDDSKIQEATVKSSCGDLLSNKLPILTMEVKLDNRDQQFDPHLQNGYSKYLSERQRVNIQWGFSVDSDNVEWLDAIPLYLDKWDIPHNSPTVTLSTTSRSAFLTQTYTKGVYTGQPRTFREVADTVLRNSGMIIAADPTDPWELDPIFDDLKTRAPEPKDAVNNIIKLLSNAACCLFDNDPRNNFIRVRRERVQSGYSITKAQQQGDPEYSIAPRLKRISVSLYTFNEKPEIETVYSFDGSMSTDTVIEAEYNNNNIVAQPHVEVTGAVVSSVEYYARKALIHLAVPTPGEVIVTVTGKVVEESTTFVETYYNPLVQSGKEITIDNPFITEIETLNYVATSVLAMYNRRHTLKIPYLGYPELELGDTVEISSRYGDSVADITSTELKYNGGFTGTLELLGQEVSTYAISDT